MVLFRKYILKIWLSLTLKWFRECPWSVILGIHGGLVQDPVMKVEGRTPEKGDTTKMPTHYPGKGGTRKYSQQFLSERNYRNPADIQIC